MANPIPPPESQRPGLNGDRLARLAALGASRDRTRHDTPQAKSDKNGLDGGPIDQGPGESPLESEAPEGGQASDELIELRAENGELRLEIEKLTRQLEEAKQLEDAWNERQK